MQELLRVLKLPADFAAQLDPYVRGKYGELWDAVHDDVARRVDPMRVSNAMASDLFETSSPRDYTGAIGLRETPFEYLSRSARPEAVRARELLTRWFHAYPEGARPGWRGRLLAKERHVFDDAVFELYMHALLRACGFDVEVNPCEESGLTPDFRAAHVESQRVFHVEATVIHEDKADENLDRRMYQLNREASPLVTVPGFAVGVRHMRTRVGRDNLRPRHFARFLNEWFLHAKLADDCPARVYRDSRSGWELELVLMPFRDPDRKPRQIVGMQSGIARWGSLGTDKLRAAISSKQSRCRRCRNPLVIAVAFNDFALLPSESEIADALLGERQLLAAVDASSLMRRRNGAWARSTSPGGSSVGLIFVSGCWWSGLHAVRPLLWDNPRVPPGQLFRPWPLDRAEIGSSQDEPVICRGTAAPGLLNIEPP